MGNTLYIKNPIKDHPFREILEAVDEMSKQHPTWEFYQKYTCAGCGKRWQSKKVNTFARFGVCIECSYETNIEEKGCNYAIKMPVEH